MWRNCVGQSLFFIPDHEKQLHYNKIYVTNVRLFIVGLKEKYRRWYTFCC